MPSLSPGLASACEQGFPKQQVEGVSSFFPSIGTHELLSAFLGSFGNRKQLQTLVFGCGWGWSGGFVLSIAAKLRAFLSDRYVLLPL